MSVPTTMKALILKGDGYSGTSEGPRIDDLGTWLDLKEVEVPKPQAGQILIKVHQSGINPSDLHFIKGEYGIPRVQGKPAGFEGCGTVVETGEGADGLMGKRVGFIATASGAWAEYAMSDIKNVVPVHDSLSDDDAAALFVNPLTALAMIEETKATGTESFILSAAASQLCKLMIVLGKQEGMKPIALVRHDEQMAHLTELGAHQVLNVRHEDFMATMMGVMRAEKPRVFLDAVGDQTSADLFAAMPNRGEWVIYGKLSPELPTLTQPGQFIFMGKKIRGFWLTPWLSQQEPQKIMEIGAKVQKLFAGGGWKTEVAARVALDEAHEQLPALLAKPNMGKIMILGNAG